MPKSKTSLNLNASFKKINNKHKPSKSKKKCHKVQNPWHDILMNSLLRTNRKQSKNQINIWCKIIKNAENDGRKCVQEYDNPKKKHKLSKWNKICKK